MAPPEALLPNFDPAKLPAPKLRSLLLEYGVSHPSNAKKGDLVALYESNIRPRAPALLRAHLQIVPSDAGILDGESAESSLAELDTDPEDEEGRYAGVSKKKKGSSRKSLGVKSRKSLAKLAGEDSEELERQASTPRKASGRKSSVPPPALPPLSPEPSTSKTPAKRRPGSIPPGEEGSPKRLKEAGGSSAEKGNRRQSLKYESGGETSFSDYNPFQSGGEDSPDAASASKSRRRKSSMGPARRSLLSPEVERPSGGGSGPRKSMPAALPSADGHRVGSWLDDESHVTGSSPAVQARLVPVPKLPPPPVPGPPVALGSPSGSSPHHHSALGKKVMIPIEKVQTTPPDVAQQLREHQRRQDRERNSDMEQQRERVLELDDDLNLPEEVELEQLDAELEAEERRRRRVRISEGEGAGVEVGSGRGGSGSVKWRQSETGQAMEGLRQELRKTPAVGRVGSGRGSQFTTGKMVAASPRKSKKDEPTMEELIGDDSFVDDTEFADMPDDDGDERQYGEDAEDYEEEGQQQQQQHQLVVRKPRSKSVQVATRASKWTTLLFLVFYALWWREEKVATGFCDTSTSTNALVSARAASHSPSLALTSLPPVLPTGFLDVLDQAHLRPSCTACPTHGVCRNGAFTGCDNDYVPSVHPLSFGGLIPLPPRCEPDTEKLMAVAVQASKVSRMLRVRRGEVVCEGLERGRRKTRTEEAWVYGVGANELMEKLRRDNENSEAPYEEEMLDDISRLAILDLQSHGDVISWSNDGTLWLASKTAEMPLSCRARLAAVDQLDQHKSQLGGLLTALLSILWFRSTLKSRRVENKRVAELVQLALGQLRKQERLHYNDPVVTAAPHIAPSHLRDLVLQSEHSPARRQQLWKKVEKIVETNSNVRAKQVEMDGEPIRAWEWYGLAGDDGPVATVSSLYPKVE